MCVRVYVSGSELGLTVWDQSDFGSLVHNCSMDIYFFGAWVVGFWNSLPYLCHVWVVTTYMRPCVCMWVRRCIYKGDVTIVTLPFNFSCWVFWGGYRMYAYGSGKNKSTIMVWQIGTVYNNIISRCGLVTSEWDLLVGYIQVNTECHEYAHLNHFSLPLFQVQNSHNNHNSDKSRGKFELVMVIWFSITQVEQGKTFYRVMSIYSRDLTVNV
jgi:hypothetical protein